MTQIESLDRAIARCGGQPPIDFARFITIDPGHSYFAALFWAVPPPSEFGDFLVIYDELYLQRHTARQCAEKMAAKMRGCAFERMVMDFRYSRQHASGTGKTYRQIYSEQFEQFNVVCNATGHIPEYSNDDIEAGCMAVRELFAIRTDGTPRLRVVVENVPNWVREIKTYKKKITRAAVEDTPASGQRDHLMDCTRYGAMANFRYVPPKPVEIKNSPVYDFYLNHIKRQDPRDPKSVYMGPGAAPAA